MAAYYFLLLERPEEALAAPLHRWLARHPLSGHGRLILISPAWAPSDAPITHPASSILLLPGDSNAVAAHFQADCMVSYGGRKDSFSISSMEGNRLSVAVQRELPNLSGGTVEEQELVLPMHHPRSPLAALAMVGSLLLLGADPASLMADPPF